MHIQEINAFLMNNQIGVLSVLIVVATIMCILLINLYWSVSYMKKRYKKMMTGTSGTNLERLIIGHVQELERIDKQQLALEEKQKQQGKVLEKAITRIGVVRYRALENLAGDLSYSIALLDAYSDGMVLSSIFSRDGSQTYAKPIKNGESEYTLSEEERKAIRKAING